MATGQFPYRKRGIFRRGKEIKGLRGGVHRYAAQANPQIDAAMAKKNRFRTETSIIPPGKKTIIPVARAISTFLPHLRHIRGVFL
jgi:hypothetical protein